MLYRSSTRTFPALSRSRSFLHHLSTWYKTDWDWCSTGVVLMQYWVFTFTLSALPASRSFLLHLSTWGKQVVEFIQWACGSLRPHRHILHGAVGGGRVTEFSSTLPSPVWRWGRGRWRAGHTSSCHQSIVWWWSFKAQRSQRATHADWRRTCWLAAGVTMTTVSRARGLVEVGGERRGWRAARGCDGVCGGQIPVSFPISVPLSVLTVVGGALRLFDTTRLAVGDVFNHGQPGHV